MGHLLRTIGRELLLRTPVLRDRYFSHEFARRRQSFRGVYGSFAEALKQAPASKPFGYEHEDDTAAAEPVVETFNPADYSVLYWLTRVLPEVRQVFDLGGNMGVAFYAYRRFLDFSPGLRWTVCEIPSTVQAGRALAAKRGESQLAFTEDRAEAADAELYFTAGALQYIEEPFAEMLAQLRQLPRHLIVHRVPLQQGEPFVTLQNNGTWVAPYKVANERAFIAGVTALGYELVAQWPTWRKLQLLQPPPERGAEYQGMYFRRRS